MIDTSTLAEDFAAIYRHLDYAVPSGGLRIEVARDVRDAASYVDNALAGWVRMSLLTPPTRPDEADIRPDDIRPDEADLYRAIERIVRAGVIDSIWCVEGVIVLDARIDTATHPPGDQPCPAHSTI